MAFSTALFGREQASSQAYKLVHRSKLMLFPGETYPGPSFRIVRSFDPQSERPHSTFPWRLIQRDVHPKERARGGGGDAHQISGGPGARLDSRRTGELIR